MTLIELDDRLRHLQTLSITELFDCNESELGAVEQHALYAVHFELWPNSDEDTVLHL